MSCSNLHLLQSGWSFWHDRYVGPNASAEEYAASLNKLYSFDTIEVRPAFITLLRLLLWLVLVVVPKLVEFLF